MAARDPNTVPANDRAQMVRMYREGMHLDAIKKETKYGAHTVTACIKAGVGEIEYAEIVARNCRRIGSPSWDRSKVAAPKTTFKFDDTFAIAFCSKWGKPSDWAREELRILASDRALLGVA